MSSFLSSMAGRCSLSWGWPSGSCSGGRAPKCPGLKHNNNQPLSNSICFEKIKILDRQHYQKLIVANKYFSTIFFSTRHLCKWRSFCYQNLLYGLSVSHLPAQSKTGSENRKTDTCCRNSPETSGTKFLTNVLLTPRRRKMARGVKI